MSAFLHRWRRMSWSRNQKRFGAPAPALSCRRKDGGMALLKAIEAGVDGVTTRRFRPPSATWAVPGHQPARWWHDVGEY
ncbi:hypothetical protein KCP78_02435 [Salmonella enterica subsp. enterica]|nr:hypothetical protein KCP78_02435 [Salmonella enterica subsp. enterica]